MGQSGCSQACCRNERDGGETTGTHEPCQGESAEVGVANAEGQPAASSLSTCCSTLTATKPAYPPVAESDIGLPEPAVPAVARTEPSPSLIVSPRPVSAAESPATPLGVLERSNLDVVLASSPEPSNDASFKQVRSPVAACVACDDTGSALCQTPMPAVSKRAGRPECLACGGMGCTICKTSDVPASLVLATAGAARACDGVYDIEEGGVVNGQPVWMKNDRSGLRLYSGTDGRWHAGDGDGGDFRYKRGVIQWKDQHCGVMPHRGSTGWVNNDGEPICVSIQDGSD